jgi:hypothetical protein
VNRHIAVIGTAGRDRSPLFTRTLWEAMRRDLAKRIEPSDTLVSGGAAWADHLAVDAFVRGKCKGLELYLPAPLFTLGDRARFVGDRGSSGSAANYYHELFSRVVGYDTMMEIAAARALGAYVVNEQPARGYGAMKRRNEKVAARCSEMIAYTFGDGDEPEDGGTQHTWSLAMCHGKTRVHVHLGALVEQDEI